MTGSASAVTTGSGVGLSRILGVQFVVLFGASEMGYVSCSVSPVTGRSSLMSQSSAIPSVKGLEVVTVSTHEGSKRTTDSGIVSLGSGGVGLGSGDGSFITFVGKSCLFFVVLGGFLVFASKSGVACGMG